MELWGHMWGYREPEMLLQQGQSPVLPELGWQWHSQGWVHIHGDVGTTAGSILSWA